MKNQNFLADPFLSATSPAFAINLKLLAFCVPAIGILISIPAQAGPTANHQCDTSRQKTFSKECENPHEPTEKRSKKLAYNGTPLYENCSYATGLYCCKKGFLVGELTVYYRHRNCPERLRPHAYGKRPEWQLGCYKATESGKPATQEGKTCG